MAVSNARILEEVAGINARLDTMETTTAANSKAIMDILLSNAEKKGEENATAKLTRRASDKKGIKLAAVGAYSTLVAAVITGGMFLFDKLDKIAQHVLK